MLEKEIKILEVDIKKITLQLEKLWAQKHFEWFIHDVYYDFPADGKNKMEANNRLFRVRKRGETHLYTIKRKRTDKKDWWEKWYKIADEGEREITDVDSFKRVLEWYGMEKVREKKKYRISYSLNNMEFDIDTYEEIPTLLEIEAHTKEEIDDFIIKLWLQDNIKKDFWSRWLFKYYWKDYSYL